MAGNECADRIAKYQANLKDDNLTDAGIPSAGPGGNPFFNIAWLAREAARPTTHEFSFPIANLNYLPDLKNALKSHMYAKHRLGYADCKTGYYTHYQSLLSHVNKGISNAFWNIPCKKERKRKKNYAGSESTPHIN
eukprot:92378-Pelagomonas_calceolata.AAC.1